MESDRIASLVYLMLLLAAIGGWVLVEFRQRFGQTLRTALAWGLIFVGVMAGFGLWSDLRRDIIPAQVQGQSGEITVNRAADGHYYLRLAINGTELSFMVDTGASNIVLSPADALVLGFDPARLVYLGEASTANGVVRTARVTLDRVELGPYQDVGIGASVNEAAMDGSLLGMDYLGLFQIEIAGDRMILRR